MKKLLPVVFVLLGTNASTFSQSAKLQTFPLSSVKLLESPFKKAQQDDINYILSLDEDRLLAPFLKDAGIKPLKENYGNWESDGLDGHIAGHYLSAVAQMYAATGNKIFLDRMNYMLGWLAKCQAANGNGYVGGIPNSKELWSEVAKGNVGIVYKRWVPWYNIHKLYSGLIDAYLITGNQQAKQILVKLSDWCITLTSHLTDEQMQQMLAVEHGGMNEVLANVASITGDQKYMEAAKRFSHRAILNPLLEKKDLLTGLHANTQIPKVVGFMRIAQLNNDKQWADASAFFWQTVTQNRSIAFGGNSVREHFNPVDDFTPMLESREGPETCNSYNMLKLTKELFLSNPLSKYMDYYERTMYNHILSSQQPSGGFVYFTPIRPNHYKVYSSPQKDFWCCVGTGLENHGKYGELIYAHSSTDLFVNLFVPSVLNWKEKGLTITQQTKFPFAETTTLKIGANKPQQLMLKFRKPSWINGSVVVMVNGKTVQTATDENGYLSISRMWKQGDVVTLKLPMKTVAEGLPDNSHWISFVHGPIVLAAATDTTDLKGLQGDGSRWGHIANGKLVSLEEAPLLVIDSLSKMQLPVETDTSKLIFSAANIINGDKYKSLKLVPFYQVQDTRYVVYWPYTTKEELPQLQKSIKDKEAFKLKLEAATIDIVYPGEQQPEADHHFKGEKTFEGFFREKHFRAGKGWFSYDLRNAGANAGQITFTYYGAEKNKQFDVYANEQLIASIDLQGTEGNEFRIRSIDLPASLASSPSITIKFKAKDGAELGNIYEVRLLKK